MKRFFTRMLLVAAATFFAATPLWAADVYWTGGDGNFNDPAHWTGGVLPGPSDQARVCDGSTATIDAPLTSIPAYILAGFGAGTSGTINQTAVNLTLSGGLLGIGWDGVGTYNISGGSLTTQDASNSGLGFRVGWNGTGTVNITNGAMVDVAGRAYMGVLAGSANITVSGTDPIMHSTLQIAKDFDLGFAGGTGTMTVSGTSELITLATGAANVGGAYGNTGGSGTLFLTDTAKWTSTSYVTNVALGGTTGLLDMSGDSTASFTTLFTGNGVGSKGTLRMSGHASLSNAGDFQMANGGADTTGTVVMDGFSSINQVGYIVGGAFAGTNASLTMNADSSFVQSGGAVWIGNLDADATFTLNGNAAFQNTGDLGTTIGSTAGHGTLNLNGGIYQTVSIAGTANGTVNFNGGVLKASNDSAAWLGTDVVYNVKSVGAKIDSNGFNVTASGSLTEDPTSLGGGLTKTGLGNLTLAAAQSYAGDTNILAGTLALTDTASLPSNVNVAAEGTLAGVGSIFGDVVVQGTHAPGNSTGVQTVNGNYTMDGNLAVEIAGSSAGTGYDQVLVSGSTAHNVALGGNLTLDWSSLSGSADNALWILQNDTAGTLTGTFGNYADGALLGTYDGKDWLIHYGADFATGSLTGGNDVALTPVPEPATLVLLGMSILGLMAWAWRRNGKAA